MSMNLLAWAIYGLFVAAATYLNWHPETLSFAGSLGGLKAILLVVFIAFLAYSIRCSMRENIISTVKQMARLYWGRQIMLDLYLGLFITLLLIFWHQGLVVMLLWALPVLAFGNLAGLLYVLLQFDPLLERFLTSMA